VEELDVARVLPSGIRIREDTAERKPLSSGTQKEARITGQPHGFVWACPAMHARAKPWAWHPTCEFRLASTTGMSRVVLVEWRQIAAEADDADLESA
jgi:hypothetical protein